MKAGHLSSLRIVARTGLDMEPEKGETTGRMPWTKRGGGGGGGGGEGGGGGSRVW